MGCNGHTFIVQRAHFLYASQAIVDFLFGHGRAISQRPINASKTCRIYPSTRSHLTHRLCTYYTPEGAKPRGRMQDSRILHSATVVSQAQPQQEVVERRAIRWRFGQRRRRKGFAQLGL